MKISGILLILPSFCAFGQNFEGYSIEGGKHYHCLFQINTDSTITYIYDRNENDIYAAYVGEISKKTDSTYRVKAKLEIGQYIMKSFNKDTLYIQLDSTIAGSLDAIQVEYANQKKRKQFQGYDNMGKPIPLIKMPVDKELFNANKGTDFVKITVNRKNRITRDWVSFKIPYGSAASISKGDEIEFEVTLENGTLKSIGPKPIQTGHIKLEKK